MAGDSFSNNAFKSFTSLDPVNRRFEVTTVSNYAFINRMNLTTVTLLVTPQTIGSYIFMFTDGSSGTIAIKVPSCVALPIKTYGV
jgi:hypothetical protein